MMFIRYRKIICVTRGLMALSTLALSLPVLSDEPSEAQLLLTDYFDKAAVCATASVEAISEPAPSIVSILLAIEPVTQRGLLKMSLEQKDDWFSLHCPPQFHPVWQRQPELADIVVTGSLAVDEVHELSCVQYQNATYNRIKDARNRVRKRLDELFDN